MGCQASGGQCVRAAHTGEAVTRWRMTAVTKHPARGGVAVGLKGYSVAGSPGRVGQVMVWG